MIRRCQRGFAMNARGSLEFLPRLFAGHFDVSAEQNGRETEIGFASAEPEQPGPNPKLKTSTLTSKKPRRPIVPQFVDQDHDPDQDKQPPDILNYEP